MLSPRGFIAPWVRTKPSSWCGIAKTLVTLRLGLVLTGGLVLEKRSLGVSQLKSTSSPCFTPPGSWMKHFIL